MYIVSDLTGWRQARSGGEGPKQSTSFSEEKTQKIFIFCRFPPIRPRPGSVRLRRINSLLVLFFRKEHAYLLA
jgi:hypothetical protein